MPQPLGQRNPPTVAFTVTTRSRLKSARFLFPMLRASRRIHHQLASTPGCLRFANIVMAPREVWTLTVWRSRQEMLDFMSSGPHEDIMWTFSKWLESFWLMRWRPGDEEEGTWRGLELSRRASPAPLPPRSPQQQAALAAALESLPRLKAAIEPGGRATLEHSPSQKRARRMVEGAVGGTLRVEVSRKRSTPAVWRKIGAMRKDLLHSGEALRCAIGMSDLRSVYLLALFPSEEAWSRFATSERVLALRTSWPDGVWSMRWDADNEFGHWDGLRLRKVKLGTAVEVPGAAKEATEDSGDPRSAE